MPKGCSIRWLALLFLCAAIPAAPQAAMSFGSPRSASPALDDTGVDSSAALPSEDAAQAAGETLLVRQRYQAALQWFQKIALPSPIVWNEMGMAYQMLYDNKDAMHCYKESLRLNPANANALNNLATIQDGMKDFGRAEGNYRKALKLEPNSAITLKNLGTNLLMQHKYEAGSAAYQQALSLDPHVFDSHGGPRVIDPAPEAERATAAYFKARGCARAGLNDCAIAFLRQAISEGVTLKRVSNEEDFAPLRDTAAYAHLMAIEH